MSEPSEFRAEVSGGGLWTRPGVHALLVLLIAIGARLLYWAQAQSSPFPARLHFLEDAYYYAQWSQEIAGGQWIGDHAFFMGPLYPYTLGILSALFGLSPITLPGIDGGETLYDYRVVFFLQAVIGALSCVGIFAIARHLTSAWPAFIAGLLAALYRPFIFFEGLLMPSSQVLFVSVLSLLLLLVAARRGGFGWWLGAGVALGLASLAKGPSLLLLPGIWVWLAVAFRDLPWQARLRNGLLVSVGTLSLVALATAHNLASEGDGVLITSNAGTNLAIGNGPRATGAHAGVALRYPSAKLDFYRFKAERKPGEPPASEVSRVLRNEALRWITENPGPAMALLWKKFRMYWNDVEVGTSDHFYFSQRFSSVLRWPTPGFGVVAAFGVLGMLLALRSWRRALPLFLLFWTQALIFTLFFVLGRFRFPGTACLIVFAAIAFEWIGSNVSARRFKPLALATVVVVLAALFTHLPVEGMERTRGLGNQYFLLARVEASTGEDPLPSFRAAVEHPWRAGDLSLRQKAMSHIVLGDALTSEGRSPAAVKEYLAARDLVNSLSPDSHYIPVLRQRLEKRLKRAP